MRVFVSSSFEDLREHRAAAIRVLRQLGHDVLAMEDMTAGSVAPLAKVLDMPMRMEEFRASSSVMSSYDVRVERGPSDSTGWP